jgi:hypothetical protein
LLVFWSNGATPYNILNSIARQTWETPKKCAGPQSNTTSRSARGAPAAAFGTAGLSLGVTPDLSTFGKVLVAAVMLLGRVGPITILVALVARQRPPLYKVPEEDIAIG